ncbi:MAG: hypothetical protein AB8C13_05435 [Phycisphaerales bacterium]
MNTKAFILLTSICTLVPSVVLPSTAWGTQPSDQQATSRASQQSGQPDRQQSQPTEAELRERLEQTLVFAQRIVEKHEEAIAQLEAGVDPKDVMRSLRTPEVRRADRKVSRQHQDQTADANPRAMNAGFSPPPQPSKKDLKRVRAFIADHLLDVDAQLKRVEEISPESTDKLIARLAPKIMEIITLEEHSTEMASLKLDELKAGLWYVEAARQLRGLVRTGSQDKDAIEQAEDMVRKAATARFEAQVHIKQYEIHELTSRIEQLHDALIDLESQCEEQVQAQVDAARRTPGPRHNRPANAAPTNSDD